MTGFATALMLCFCLLLPAGRAVAASVPPTDLANRLARLEDQARHLPAGDRARAQSNLLQQAYTLRSRLTDCIRRAGQQRDLLRGRLRAETAKPVAAGLVDRLAREQTRGDRCTALRERTESLIAALRARDAPPALGDLRRRGPSLWQIFSTLRQAPLRSWLPAARKLAAWLGLPRLQGVAGIMLLLLTALAGAGGALLGMRLRRYLRQTARLGLGPALAAETARVLPALAALAAALGWLWFSHPPGPADGLDWLTLAALCYAAGHTLIRGTLAPPGRTPFPLPVSPVLARRLARRTQAALLLALVIGLTLIAPLRQPETFFLALRGVLVTLISLDLLGLLLLLARLPGRPPGARLVWRAGAAALAATVASEWLGYRQAADTLLRGTIGTLACVAGFWLVGYGLRTLFRELESGHRPWQSRLRQRVGVAPGEPLPGLGWMRAAVWICAWVVFALLVLEAWGLSHSGLHSILRLLQQGFGVGSVRVVPLRVLEGLVAFAALLVGTRWVRDRIRVRVSASPRLDRGAQDAAVTLAGYAGFLIAAVVALSLAGVNLANLALVAGALSVGIGFGLQNIVNNFVSGLILLFERPIRSGDYVSVGATEGFVRRISIRSTELETLDRTNVIVPNSELISGQVTNWMLNDPYGRITLQIGVAYGSDVRLVERLLLQVARDHPEVIVHAEVPPPAVYFTGFGDSSLTFELRAVVRDTSQRFQVRSDMNFAIDALFREHDIEIPFPQRDVHLRPGPGEGGTGRGLPKV